jgi:hypothetical protein
MATGLVCLRACGLWYGRCVFSKSRQSLRDVLHLVHRRWKERDYVHTKRNNYEITAHSFMTILLAIPALQVFVTWGDGQSTSVVTNGAPGALNETHQYGIAGNYTITVQQPTTMGV